MPQTVALAFLFCGGEIDCLLYFIIVQDLKAREK